MYAKPLFAVCILFDRPVHSSVGMLTMRDHGTTGLEVFGQEAFQFTSETVTQTILYVYFYSLSRALKLSVKYELLRF